MLPATRVAVVNAAADVAGSEASPLATGLQLSKDYAYMDVAVVH
jgi:hypothetical protein